MKHALVVVWSMVGAAPALADVVVFDNRAGTFLMHPFHAGGSYSWPGDYFDPIRSPAQNPVAESPTTISAWSASAPTSSVCLPDYFRGGMYAGNSSIYLACNAPTFTPCPGGQTISLATTFAPGTALGTHTAPAAGWRTFADFSYSHIAVVGPLLGDPAIIGFRVSLADGAHYGWVAFTWQVMSTVGGPVPTQLPGYTPIAWGYESTPDAAVSVPPLCFANCDLSAVQPVLNAGDFTCFLNRFASGDPFANCDASTVPPVLNVNDFLCFLQRFAAGCT